MNRFRSLWCVGLCLLLFVVAAHRLSAQTPRSGTASLGAKAPASDADAPPLDAPPLDLEVPDAPSISHSTDHPHAHDEKNMADVASSLAPGDDDKLEASSIENESNRWPPFLYQALYASLLVAVVCSYLGLFVVLRRIVFVGVALAELSSAGIALALYFSFAPLLGSVAFTLIGIALFSLRLAPRRVPSESFIGIIYVIAGALAILLIAKSAGGETHMLKLMQGDVLTVDPSETRQMLFAFLAIAVLHLAFAKEFVLVSFDRDAASTLGFGAARWEWLLLMTIGVTISFAIRATGVLLTSTMLIVPAITALLVTRHLRAAMIAAPLLALGPVVLGLHLSLILDVPASAMIVALSCALLLPALAWEAFSNRRA